MIGRTDAVKFTSILAVSARVAVHIFGPAIFMDLAAMSTIESQSLRAEITHSSLGCSWTNQTRPKTVGLRRLRQTILAGDKYYGGSRYKLCYECRYRFL